MKTKNKPSRQKTIFIAISLIVIISGAILAFPASSRAETGQVPVVALWVAWNDLALNLDEIEQIPTDKFNAVQLSFYFPIRDGITGDYLKQAIQRIHNRGLKVMAFVNMEFDAENYNQLAQNRAMSWLGVSGDEYPHNFMIALQEDGNPILKSETMKLGTFFDSEYRDYIQRKIRLLRDCGADNISVGELGYSMNRAVTSEALQQFETEEGVSLPTTELGPTLSEFFLQNIAIEEKLWYWKYKYMFAWLEPLNEVDSVGRYTRGGFGHTAISPIFPGEKLANTGEFLANDPPTQAIYDHVLQRIDLLSVPGVVNIGAIQFAVGNTAEISPYVEDIPNRARFLAQYTDGFTFYGSALWKQYKNYYQYLPNLADYISQPEQSADLNSDNLVNQTDFDILKTDFLKLTSQLANPKSDIDGDGQATIKDVGIMMSGWKL